MVGVWGKKLKLFWLMQAFFGSYFEHTFQINMQLNSFASMLPFPINFNEDNEENSNFAED